MVNKAEEAENKMVSGECCDRSEQRLVGAGLGLGHLHLRTEMVLPEIVVLVAPSPFVVASNVPDYYPQQFAA